MRTFFGYLTSGGMASSRGVFDKSHIHQASSAHRLVIEATYSL